MSFEERAKALLLLKDSLGDFYEEQKNYLLDDVLKLPLNEYPVVLSSLVSCNFITPQELSLLLTKKTTLTKSLSEISEEITKNNETQEEKKEEIKEEKQDDVNLSGCSNFDDIKNYLKIRNLNYDNLLSQLSNSIGISNLEELLNLEETHQSFNILDELLSEELKEEFSNLIKDLKNTEFVKKVNDKRELSDSIINEQRKSEELVDTQIYNFQSNISNIIVIPILKKFYFYGTIELDNEENLISSSNINDEKSENVFFCLDISASMNHNEKGEYCAPKSKDHEYSSILKARKLIPNLALEAIKRYANVFIIVWNFKVQNVIQFTPEMFIPEDSKELLSNEEILSIIIEKTSENVFLAKGGTNIEAALNQLQDLFIEYEDKMSSAIVWFLTDGEETVFVKDKQNNKMERIPSNPQATKYGYFNHTNNKGITQYQATLLNRLSTSLENLSNKNISIEFHVCQFSEADPMFLRCMREASNGYFHTLVDVGNLSKELSAENSSSQFFIKLKTKSGNILTFPAAINNNVLYARGILPNDIFISDFLLNRSIIIEKGNNLSDNLSSFSTFNFNSEILKNGISNIIQLEPSLELILQNLNDNLNIETINNSSIQLNKLRKIRMDALASIIRIVKAGTMLQMFLESILESVESQIDSLERLLSQFQKNEGVEFDKISAKSNDLLSFREKMAISAGLESMRVRLGNGFVSQSSLDKRIRQLISKNGIRARKMLKRHCILVESLLKGNNNDKTWLSLYIIEDKIYEFSKSNYINNKLLLLYSNENENYISKLNTELNENYIHYDNNSNKCYIELELKITNRISKHIKIIKDKIDILEYYKNILTEYHCQPLENDLDEMRKRFVDPLSYCSFIDLIKENNTLPAFLYKIGTSQSVGLLFNAKELMFVKDGGKDSTSFDYFRLYWRLAQKKNNNENNYVTVPGCFTEANAALPMAPEPLTNLVLSNLMPGLLSEFITGTPMAPMSGSILFYGGYLMMHMHKNPVTGVDISRMVEIISTITTWILNPYTYPNNDDFNNIIKEFIETKTIKPKDSPGKRIPVKILIYSIIDDNYEILLKHKILQDVILQRLFKRLTSQNDKLINIKSESLKFIENATGDIIYDENTINDIKIPISLLNTGETISLLMKNNNKKDNNNNNNNNNEEYLKKVNNFMNNSLHIYAVIELLFNNIPLQNEWNDTQRLLYSFYILGEKSTSELLDRFKNFKTTDDIENLIAKQFNSLKNIKFKWENIIISWIDNDNNYFVLEYINDLKNLKIWEVNTMKLLDNFNFSEFNQLNNNIKIILWNSAFKLLKYWYWNGRISNCFGLLDIDYDIIKAIKNFDFIKELDQNQLSEYHSAMAYKKPQYLPYVPKQEEVISIKSEDNFSIDSSLINESGKPRVSLIVIGAVDSGKCFLKNTEIMMYDGSIKYIQNIKKNDIIMGDDSLPRKVLNITNGIDNMYTIIQNNKYSNISYTVTSNHILVLKSSFKNNIIWNSLNNSFEVSWIENLYIKKKIFYISSYFFNKEKTKKEAINFLLNIIPTYKGYIKYGDIIEIKAKNFIKLPKNIRKLYKGFYNEINFKDKYVKIDPYIIGYILGNNNINNINNLNYYFNNKINNYINILKEFNIFNNKYIPNNFKINSKEKRLKLLTGIIDGNNNIKLLKYNKNNNYIFKNEYKLNIKSNLLKNDIIFIVKSLGYKIISNNENITIIIKNKNNNNFNLKNINSVESSIDIKTYGINNYYGFETNGNHKFLLGDFTITHNSTTSGHLIYQRGAIPEFTMKKCEQLSKEYGRESFKYAWIMDRLVSERSRGITIELSVWSLETNKYQMDLLDAPGHQSFLKNMASGASLSDAALLVISAAPGEFEAGICKSGMTRQESLLAYASGVRQFIIAINKMDRVNYSEERFNEVRIEVSRYLKKLGIPEHRQIYIPISGWKGDNLVNSSENMPWFKEWQCKHTPNGEIITGKTLIDAIDYGINIPRRSINNPLRIPILRTYKIQGIGTVATGRIASGILKPGQELSIHPLNKNATVRSIESYHKPKVQVYPGDIIGVHLPGIKVDDVQRGAVLAPANCPPIGVTCFYAKIMIIEHNNIRKGFAPYIYCHTASFVATCTKLIQKLDKRSGKEIEDNPTILKTGDAAIVKFVTDKLVCVEAFTTCPPLARFVMKVSNTLIGIGQITQVHIDDPDLPKRQSSSNKVKSKYFR